jgi:putative ABC transport system ATP-binding protein
MNPVLEHPVLEHPVLELRAVSKEYPGSPPVVALDRVDLAIHSGELLAIVGPSGSGKSTLLHVMGTLDRPSSGSMLLEGRDVTDCDDTELSRLRARTIGFVFQQFFLLEGSTALDNVATGLLYRDRGGRRGGALALAERRAEASRALEMVGLSHRLHHKPGELSGGERQRVAIARALVGRPALVLADEPTGNLDSVAGNRILELLLDLHAGGATIAVITHDREVADQLGRKVVLRDGRIEHDRPAGPGGPPPGDDAPAGAGGLGARTGNTAGLVPGRAA